MEIVQPKKERNKGETKNQLENKVKMVIKMYLSVIDLNVNGLNAPIKRQRKANWIKKQEPTICSLKETHLRAKDTYRLQVRRWKKIFHVNGNDSKVGVTILISDKMDFKNKGHALGRHFSACEEEPA